MSTTYLFGSNSIFAKIDNFTSLGMDTKLDKMLGFTRPETEGPRLSDLSVQTSTYGSEIPRYYGTCAGTGNLIALENNKLKERVRKKKSGGKGGGGASEPTTTYSYSATFQLALCEGPIAGVRRIWCGDKLIYNAGSNDLDTIIASNQAAKGWRLYRGTDDQLPDPRYEAEYGVGNVSAHRGLAYIAFYDFQLADYSNTLQAAQFKVEVVTELDNPLFIADDTAIDQSTIKQCLAGIDDSGRSIYVVKESSDVISSFYAKNGIYGFESSYSGEISGLVALSVFHSLPGFSGSVIRGLQEELPNNTVFLVGNEYCVLSDSAPAWTISPDKGVAAYDGRVYLFDASNIYLVIQGAAQEEYPLSLSPGLSTIGGGVINGVPVFFRSTGSAGEAVAFSISDSGITDLFSIDNGSVKYFRSVLVHAGYIYSVENGTLTPASGVAISRYTLDGEFIERREMSGYVDGYDTQAANGVIALYDANSGSDLKIALDYITATEPSLASVIAHEFELSSLILESDIDVSLLSSTVKGYRVAGGTIRAALEPLQSAYPFDVIQSGYQIKCVPRGQTSIAVIPWEDLGATDGDEPGDILRQSREMDTQLPARTTVKYMDAAREYAITEQYSERLNTEAVNRVERELPMVLTADEAARISEILNFLPWLERTDASFVLPPAYLALESSDVITVETQQATYELRLDDVSYTADGRLECKAKPNRAALYTPNATGGEGVQPSGTVPLAGESIFIPLDIPVVDETLQNDVGFVGAMTGTTNSWPGGLLVRSNDEGQTWTDVQGFTGKASIGTARGTLPASFGTLIDQRSLVVDMISGELESVTLDQMLSGVNYAAYGVDGRWEIVRFQNAPLQADGSNRLSGFVRGDRGTEWASGLHAVGDYFVLLDDPDNIFIGSPVESVGLSRLYRGVTSGSSVDDATDVSFAYQGVNLECLRPVYGQAARDGSGNVSATFARRSRLSSSWWTNGVVAPVGEATEAYEIDVMSGSTVKRTISASTPAFSYSATDQTIDFGSVQSSITFRIHQLSAVVGRGYAYEVTL